MEYGERPNFIEILQELRGYFVVNGLDPKISITLDKTSFKTLERDFMTKARVEDKFDDADRPELKAFYLNPGIIEVKVADEN